jgi:hypothetical protein
VSKWSNPSQNLGGNCRAFNNDHGRPSPIQRFPSLPLDVKTLKLFVPINYSTGEWKTGRFFYP